MKIAKRIREEIDSRIDGECFMFYDKQHITEQGIEIVESVITAALMPMRLTIEEILEDHLFELSRSHIENLDEIIEELS